MKLYFASALLVSALSLPANASSIELIDSTVTGAKGSSSILTYDTKVVCQEMACVDGSGGDPSLSTSVAKPLQEINYVFARKYPDPAVPVPTVAPVEAADSGLGLDIPQAPSDSGTVAAQPPVEQPTQQPTEQASMNPSMDGSTPGAGQPDEPKAPIMPLADSELRDSE